MMGAMAKRSTRKPKRPGASSTDPNRLVDGVLRYMEHTDWLFERGEPAGLVGTVSGSEAASAYWRRHLEASRKSLRARETVSFHEDLPVGQAFGLLLLWKRLKEKLRPREGALVAFVFGEGTRAAPFTEAECGQKPAIRSFVSQKEKETHRLLPIVELALRYFAPVESHLRRSGFEGMVVKWGDEVQIPISDPSGTNPLFEDADIVRFVSMRKITAEDARSKDWVGVDEAGRITAFIPRRPLEQMAPLADRGLLQRRGDDLYGGINLGSIAISRLLLDLLLEEFEHDVLDPRASRGDRPDLDPQLFTALTIARISEREKREREWSLARAESEAIMKLENKSPGILCRLRRVLELFRRRHGREARMVAMDFEDQYWGDIGQHRQIYDFYMALAGEGPGAKIARALASLPDERDANGNILAGGTVLGEKVRASGSVLIDVRIDAGEIVNSVLIGTRCNELNSDHAFDIQSVAKKMNLASRSGAYRVISGEPVEARTGQRLATIFLSGSEMLLRANESTDLRDLAASYDVPILGNEMSFRKAHKLVTATDPERIDRRRSKKRVELLTEGK